jgi:hypothetical protein
MIRTETHRIEQATGCYAPVWIEKGDNDYRIDYSRFKPRGFYSQTDALSRYFRALGWLQSVPFRVDRDDELLAILALGRCMAPGELTDETKRQRCLAFFKCCRESIGDRDDWDLTVASNIAPAKPTVDFEAVAIANRRTVK